MKTYTVHLNPADPKPENIILVKEGFSWLAFFLGMLFTLYHRMWLLSFILIILDVVLSILMAKEIITNEIIIYCISFGIKLLLASNYHDFYRHKLSKKGYIFQGIASGKNEDEAYYKFVADMLQRNTFVSS